MAAKQPTFRKRRQPVTLLTLTMGSVAVTEVTVARLPVALNPDVELSANSHLLTFQEPAGTARVFDLSSAVQEGATRLWLSVRVFSHYAVQVDGLLTVGAEDPRAGFITGAIKGVRLQPFFLAPAAAENTALAGRGLFARGLHFGGHVTRRHVSLLCLCDSCQHSFRVQSIHMGFSNDTYCYCGTCAQLLVASDRLPDAPPILGPDDPAQTAAFERRLPPCSRCGGTFGYRQPFRCPACRAPYIDFARHPHDREQEYYGNYLYGIDYQRYEG